MTGKIFEDHSDVVMQRHYDSTGVYEMNRAIVDEERRSNMSFLEVLWDKLKQKLDF